MNLLPKSQSDFRSRHYWDTFFRQRGGKSFEWYGEYTDLCGLIHKYAKPSSHSVLMLGCGNSRLGEDMYDVGYKYVVNIDISDVVIRQMIDRNSTKRPDLKFVKMDATDMTFDDSSFDVVLDKGTLDAMMSGEESEVEGDVSRMFVEIRRVLKPGGRYFCLSLAQDHILNALLDRFGCRDWFVRVHRVDIVSGHGEDQHGMPLFAFIMTKAKTGLTFQVFEVCRTVDEVQRVESVSVLKQKVKEMQAFGVAAKRLASLIPGEEVMLSLWSPGGKGSEKEVLRYSLCVIDIPPSKAKNGKYAIFIVPQGRETEWMFSSEEGRSGLACSAGFHRVTMVTMIRGQTYESLDAVKRELSAYVMAYAPPGLPTNAQVPFLSVGDDVGYRVVMHRGVTEHSGEVVVEDVAHDNQSFYRRLIFLSTPGVIQSEAKLKPKYSQHQKRKAEKRGKVQSRLGKMSTTDWLVDPTFLRSAHHHKMISGLAWLECLSEAEGISVLVIGLGGGGLISYLSHFFPSFKLTVVDIDADIVAIAKTWFGFQESKNVDVIVADGLEYISQAEKVSRQFDVIMFDIDSKDLTKGLTAPPQSFIQIEILQKVDAILKAKGILMVNFACRSSELRKRTLEAIPAAGFLSVLSVLVPEQVNEIIFCLKSGEIKLDDLPSWSVRNAAYIDGVLPQTKEDENTASLNLRICRPVF
eukprot:m.158478 g.158478  ORF g.158478 m.158478 type:complete len:692 (+) comp38743_c0_seq11:626-2701(+)